MEKGKRIGFFKSGAGFSILELIIYIGIFAVMGVLGAFVFDFSIRSKQYTTRTNEVYFNTQRVLAQIVDRVQTAVVINGASTTLNLKMSDASKDPTIFALSSNAVTLQEGSGESISITPTTLFVNALTFVQVDNPSPSTSSVRIVITGGYNDDGVFDSATSYTLQTTALPL